MLDYDYIAKCDKVNELKAILGVLKSGKEGKYPHLEKTCEEKCMELMPATERKKVMSMRQQVTKLEIHDEKKSLEEWLGAMNMGASNSKLKVRKSAAREQATAASSIIEQTDREYILSRSKKSEI